MHRTSRKSLAAGLLAALALAAAVFAAAFAAAWYRPFPADKLERFSPSPMVVDAEGRHLLSVVSPDEQWSMPVGLDAMSPRVIQATIAVEDQRYYEHCGVDILAAGRDGPPEWTPPARCFRGQHNHDAGLQDDGRQAADPGRKSDRELPALQLNRLKSKQEVLEIYLNTAPYGGNIRGVEAASLLYFSKHARDLSLAEAALLAGLPKSPTRLNPRKHLDVALERHAHGPGPHGGNGRNHG